MAIDTLSSEVAPLFWTQLELASAARTVAWTALVLLVTVCGPRRPDARAADAAGSVRVTPAQIKLSGHAAVRGVLVDHLADAAAPSVQDVTHRATYESTDETIFTVDSAGVLSSCGDGEAQLVVRYQDREVRVPVSVTDAAVRREFHFERDIIPLFSKFRCNSSGCHGKAEGQNGFKLSVFGFDPGADHESLTRQGRGRRTNPAAPETSLLLTKASGLLPHGGGVRIPTGTREYRQLLGWIESGTPVGRDDAARIERIEILPNDRQLEMSWQQQLRVIAYYSDGTEEDVTSIATYQVNNEGLASIDAAGVVTVGEHPGQVAVMASYMGAVATFRALIPQAADNLTGIDRNFPAQNAIDHDINRQLLKLRVAPSGRADDAEYARRVYLDVIGTLPTADEVTSFLTDTSVDKRADLVDRLLQRPEYAAVWALRWADVLRVDRQKLGHKDAQSYYRWLHAQFAENRPFDQLARDLLTAEGPVHRQPAGHFYQVVTKAGERASTLSQVFLGTRIACAECHHHPFDRWSQTDFYGMAGYFQSIAPRSSPRGTVVTVGKTRPLSHPRTKQPIIPRPLGSEPPAESPEGDPRHELAAWMTAPDNPYFARAIVNRVWARMMGRGLVEPVDDFRETNPPSNPQLLDRLADHFVQSGFDLHELIRFIAASEAYQRSSAPNATNRNDQQNYSRALLKRMDAEVLYDAINQVTGSTDKYVGLPHGLRAIELWDSEVKHEFLTLFGRPQRKTSCECERAGQPSVSQVLHLLNSPKLEAKLRHPGGLVAQLERRHQSDEQLVTSLYLTFFAREPTEPERRASLAHLGQSTDRPAATVDLAWAMLNSLEFLFNH